MSDVPNAMDERLNQYGLNGTEWSRVCERATELQVSIADTHDFDEEGDRIVNAFAKYEREARELRSRLQQALTLDLTGIQGLVRAARDWHDFHAHEPSLVQCDAVCDALPAAERELSLLSGALRKEGR